MQLVFVAKLRVPLVSVVFPGDIVFKEHIANAALLGRRNRERRIEHKAVCGRIRAVAKVSGVVVVQQIVMAWITIGIDRMF